MRRYRREGRKNGAQPRGIVVETKGKERGPGEGDRRKEVYSLEMGGVVQARGQSTGRQLRPLSSVLYRIIYKRRYILAAQLLLREKSGT